jgi:hypothetical protein
MFYVPKYNGRTFPFNLSSEQRRGRPIIAYKIEHALQNLFLKIEDTDVVGESSYIRVNSNVRPVIQS